MGRKRKTLAGRLTRRIMLWALFFVLVLSYVIVYLEGNATREFYIEIYHNKMLVTYEYTRRVISDVYVAVTNNIYYVEHTLDNPDGHKDTMERIVKSGTRVRSCGISFIENYYYPKTGHRFCPFAWRNGRNQDIIYKEDMGDADLDYLKAGWFLDVINSDSAQWSEPFYDGYDEKTTLAAYMVPIHDQTGRPVALLGADVSLDWLASKLAETDSTINKNAMFMAGKFNLKSSSYIINHDGTFITHPEEARIMKDNFFSHLKSCDGSNVEKLIDCMKNGVMREGKSHEKFIFDGEECLVFYTPVKYTKWVMVTVLPCRVIDVLGYINGASVLFVFILAMLVIVTVCYYYIKNGIAPVRELTKLTNDIAKGKFDTPLPEMNHKDEVSQLRDAIENMQFSLSNYVDEVKRTTK